MRVCVVRQCCGIRTAETLHFCTIGQSGQSHQQWFKNITSRLHSCTSQGPSSPRRCSSCESLEEEALASLYTQEHDSQQIFPPSIQAAPQCPCGPSEEQEEEGEGGQESQAAARRGADPQGLHGAAAPVWSTAGTAGVRGGAPRHPSAKEALLCLCLTQAPAAGADGGEAAGSSTAR